MLPCRVMELQRPSEIAASFTLIELLVVITIIAILASLALPVFNRVTERARVTQDLNNLRQIGIATQTYLNDNDQIYFAPTDPWPKLLHDKYLSGWKIFISPFDKRPDTELENTAPVSYGFNANAKSATGSLAVDQIKSPSEFILFAPAQPFTYVGDGANCIVTNDSAGAGGSTEGGTHSGGTRINACFADLHVENLLWSVFHSDTPAAGSTDRFSARWHPDPK